MLEAPTAAEIQNEIDRTEEESRRHLRHLRALLKVTKDQEGTGKPEDKEADAE